MVGLLATKKNNRMQFQHGVKDIKKTKPFCRRRKVASSSGEDELDDELSDEELEVLESPQSNGDNSYIDGGENGRASSSTCRDLTFEERLEALTDAESNEEATKKSVNWLCKPRLNDSLKENNTQPTVINGKRRRAIISSSSENEGSEESSSQTAPINLKMMVKKAKKRKKIMKSSSEESEASELYDSDGSARLAESDSEDSQVYSFFFEFIFLYKSDLVT
ncbi:unnamed protein product [Gongylonema pulchrum]|uniref:Uncharacterized protein n=1 Tax=Gongylonema pulchrum TaxID=637853 RepID=A0A183E051_9BILA|nr:unnamed protein product [Gongylonema pulchrum]